MEIEIKVSYVLIKGKKCIDLKQQVLIKFSTSNV